MPPRILIVESRFYEDLADRLAAGAAAALEAAGATHERLAVPGAFEIPAAVGMAAESGGYDGFVALGCVIRGETSHYDYVCAESARGLMDLALARRIPIGYGVLTVENRKQAEARAGGAKGNKGAEAARACLAMLDIRRRFAEGDRQ